MSCANAGVSNLSGLQNFGNLTTLDLSGNPITLLSALNGLNNLTSLDLSNTTLLECSALGSLATSLGGGVLIQPSTCLGEGEQVFSVANPDKPNSNQFSFAVDTTSYGDIVSSAITYNLGTDSFDGRVFLIDGTNGNELLELQNPSPSGSDYFGWSVAALSNGDVAVGAWQDDVGGVAAAGAVHVFSGIDGAHLRTIQNPNPTLDDRFAYSIAATVSGNIAIGAYFKSGGGAVYVYDALGALQTTVANPSGDTNAEFGKSVAATSSGDIVIGAPKEDVSASGLVADAGVVHIYSEVSGTPILVIDNPQAAVNDDFGSTVAVAANDDLIISARFVDNFANNDGSVFVHNGIDGTLIWSTANPVADEDGLFGVSVAGTPQGHVVVGAANDDTGASNSGKVFVFDGFDGSLIKVIPNPTPDANVNFGQGIGITPSGQIAVGAFGADGGFGSLHLFTSVGVGEDLDLLNEQAFSDANLQSCVLGAAATNGWATVDEVTALDCSDSEISDLTGLDALTALASLDLSGNEIDETAGLETLINLTSLNLSGNPEILCVDLDALELALGAGVVIRPLECSGQAQAQQVQSLHNAQGQRVVKTVSDDPSTTLHFIYDQAGRVIAEIDATTGATTREYIYVNGIQVVLVDDTATQDEATYFVHNDHLGTPRKITDSTQTIVWAGSYEPFGEVTETVASIENNIRFPGQYKDDETGLHYNYFRDYDSSLGRYVESDPIGLAGGPSGYVYALNRPTFYIDLNGKREAVTPNVNTSLKNSAGDLFAVMNEMASMQCQGNMISRMKAHRSTLSRLSAAKGECHDSSKYQIEGYRYPQNGCITPLNLVLDHRPVSRPGWVLIERGTY